MKKVIIVFGLGILCLIGLIVSLGNDNFFYKDNNDDELVRPEFVTSMSEIDIKLPTVLMFKIPTCDDCFDMQAIYRDIHEEYDKKFNIVYYDAFEFTNLEIQNAIEEYEVIGAPTTIIMKSDKSIVAKIEGVATKDKVIECLNEAGANLK